MWHRGAKGKKKEKKMKKARILTVIVCVMAVVNVASADLVQGINIDFVTIGNAGNGGELSGAGAGGFGPDRVCGAVNYTYCMGRYEVTNAQYCEFLKAVASSDTYSLYHPNMGGTHGGITQSGSSNNFTYSVKNGWANKPVNWVSWYDSIRFINWLQNGQGSSNTENGTYTIVDGGPDTGIVTLPDHSTFSTPHFVLPTEDEWYKAGYYTTDLNKDGIHNDPGYYDYAIQSDICPTSQQVNYANFLGDPSNVGAYGLPSAYGTFDQDGNMWEWNEALIEVYGERRGMRGGSWSREAGCLPAPERQYNYGGINCGDVGFRVALIPEPGTPPIADADGPYTIYVGDTLTLDASGSTDYDNDMVSYLWDLDDNNSFETDAGDHAVFDVSYTYLQSLGLVVDNTYNIRLKVTDSVGQSDVNDTTLAIIPIPALLVFVDIKPGSCPNPVNVKSSGVLPVAILGTADFDITTIDPTSIRLAGVSPLRSSFEDVAGPVADSNDCNCTEDGPDGFLDLTLKFKTQKIVDAIGDVNEGDVLRLQLTGILLDPIPFETPIEGADCILIRGRHKPFNMADINKDGVVNPADFAIFAQNWLQSSVLKD